MAFACLPGVDVEHRPSIESALRYWPLHAGLDFADVYHLALARDHGVTTILTGNPRMNRFSGVRNVDLG
jgi:predicted nucleic acid-binding protein